MRFRAYRETIHYYDPLPIHLNSRPQVPMERQATVLVQADTRNKLLEDGCIPKGSEDATALALGAVVDGGLKSWWMTKSLRSHVDSWRMTVPHA